MSQPLCYPPLDGGRRLQEVIQVQRYYLTLDGERIDMGKLTADEKRFLGQAVKAYAAQEAYPNFVNRVNAPGSLALGGGEWVTGQVEASPLYRVCQDLADRLGVAQGFLSLGENSSVERTEPAGRKEPDYVSSEEAARIASVTGEAIRKAIREKRLPAKRVGRNFVVERQAIGAYLARGGGRKKRPADRPQSRAAR